VQCIQADDEARAERYRKCGGVLTAEAHLRQDNGVEIDPSDG
jgi:hypothetical protein